MEAFKKFKTEHPKSKLNDFFDNTNRSIVKALLKFYMERTFGTMIQWSCRCQEMDKEVARDAIRWRTGGAANQVFEKA